MDPVSAIGLASGILTFIDIGYKVVTGTLEIVQTGQAPHTEHIDAVAHDLNNAVARFSRNVSPNVAGPEKALREASVRCQSLSRDLLALLGRFKVQAARPDTGTLGDHPHLATQTQLGNSIGETRTDLCNIRDALSDVRTVLIKLEQAQMNLQHTTRSTSDSTGPLPEKNMSSGKLLVQLQEVKDALYLLQEERSEKTPETRILEHVYFGTSMFQRGETLKPADESTFRWFVEGVSSESDGDSGSINSRKRKRGEFSQGQKTGALKAEVASRFEKWLRSGSGIFHISGKAGSGKSTLMKLILSTEHTQDLLREWAGDRRLLFARFYFWAGGDHMQNSLEGLQRSILFEILIKRPELVEEVFQEAYPTISRSSWDSPIHSRFFTTSSFHRAFERLLHLQADPRYRLCLFIDGLDEYGADAISGSLPETQREDLAQSLVGWTSNTHVKILASSRPYPEFSEAFAGDQQVLLHQLTYDDMIEFGRHLFERHRTFGFPGVKQRYQDLVERVTHASDGVFLWTGLTIQRLLASLSKRDSFEALEKQLEDTPRELSALYEKMFSAIDSHERIEAMKMMLLVSEERKYLGNLSHPRGVNAMAISWLASLDDPDFPANQPFRVYNEEEIEEKRQFADSRVSGYTRGLLEVMSHPQSAFEYSPLSYLRHTVQFFHKSALEYVAASALAREVFSSLPNIFNLEFYVRLSLAELHFGALVEGFGRISYLRRYRDIFRKYLSTQNPCRYLIEAYRIALEQQVRYFAWGTTWVGQDSDTTWNRFRTTFQPSQSTSIDHWVANEVQEAYAFQYLTERIRIHPDLPHPRDGLSLLLSAACHQPEHPAFPRLDRVKMVLAFGAHLHYGISLQVGRRRLLMNLKVWQAWCLYYVSAELDAWRRQPHIDGNTEMNQILELFLKTGVDSDCYILMIDNPENSESAGASSEESDDDDISEISEYESGWEKDESVQQQVKRQSRASTWSSADEWVTVGFRQRRIHIAYVVSFREFIRQAKPVNYEQLERLLGNNNRTQGFSTKFLREIEAELATSKYPDFDHPTVRPIELNQYSAGDSSEALMVYWIRWKDETIPGYLRFRLY